MDYIRRSRLEEYAWEHRNQIPERKARSFYRGNIPTKILEYIYESNFHFQPKASMYSGNNIPQIVPLTSITSEVKGRPRPNELRKWDDFIPQQMIIWDQLMQSEFQLERDLSPMYSIEARARQCQVNYFMFVDIGGDLTKLIHLLNNNPALRASLGLTGSRVRIQSHAEILQPGSMSEENVPSDYPPEYIFCQYDGSSDEPESLLRIPERRVFFILNHKIPCDLRYDEFKDIIQPMNLDFVDCDSEKSDPKERLRWIFAAFITEAYSYMIEEKVEYGCVTTGEITIFLRIPENDGQNIYYHISAPKEDLEDFGLSTGRSEELYTINRPYLTTLGQFLAFTIQAMKSKQRPQNWCKNICQYSKRWGEIDNKLPMDTGNLEDDQSQPTPTKKPINQVSAEYCTHKCLHGLKNGGKLDKACPNWRDHGSHSHQISHCQFLDSIYNQLEKDLETNIERICTLGSCGVPFKIRLASHGYTFFAKLTPSWFVYCLQQEANIYDHMESIQGTHVPVHLGNIDLKYPYFFGRGVKLVHAMFLSFGGTEIDENILEKDYPRISKKVENTFHKIHELYILHRDTEPRNILLDRNTGQVIVIDFERAKVIEKQLVASTKSKTSKTNKGLKSRVQKTRNMQIFKNEINYVRSALKKLLDSKEDDH